MESVTVMMAAVVGVAIGIGLGALAFWLYRDPTYGHAMTFGGTVIGLKCFAAAVGGVTKK